MPELTEKQIESLDVLMGMNPGEWPPDLQKHMESIGPMCGQMVYDAVSDWLTSATK
uniref:Uncharacterized protein n=1 Tax=viral metagenome TaxID=1070528 RepID=A0A6M3J2I5_9ZZZZ